MPLITLKPAKQTIEHLVVASEQIVAIETEYGRTTVHVTGGRAYAVMDTPASLKELANAHLSRGAYERSPEF